ncbi:death-inducer obliterator 1-like isoform X1 [Macrosteles quadrilineatus]|uniref:death-inducer obliterator 1-like isoform X1 n=1 Tax=Macrosteles quadrilineatus TaxID=74068 RepID=UPI0023E2ED93|nr:death-inducer obliterator 1-like isoform X1 [Macrosteles quadrilineatus]
MSHTYIASCTNSSKDDDTLIIIVNSDGTLSVDPETLQKLLANQHHNSPISLVRLDAKGDGSGGGDGAGDEDDDPDSRVNLTVEGYYPPTPAPSSPTPPPTPVADTGISNDGGSQEMLADSITEILQPEDVEKLETALQSEHAKEILGDVVLDMLQKNGEDNMGGSGDMGPLSQGSVVLDHCYASLTGPAPPPVTTPVRGAIRGRGRPRGQPQSKMMQSMIPVVEPLVIPGDTVGSVSSNNNTKGQTVTIQGVNLQNVPQNMVACTVMLTKVPTQNKTFNVSSMAQDTAGVTTVKTVSPADLVGSAKKKGPGRGRGVTTRGGRGAAGRGRGAGKVIQTEEAKQKQLADEMAATVHALSLAEAEQFANIESMDQSSVDSDRVIPLVNKVPAKKPVKVYRRAIDISATTPGPKTLKVLKPEKHPTPQPRPRKKSTSVESSSHDDKPAADKVKREEKVIVVSLEPQITPAVVTAVVMSQNVSTTSVTPATLTPVTTPMAGSKKYPKRENRKPPAHLAEAFGPALFSTPDIIRRVSEKSGTTTPVTPAAPAASPTAVPVIPVPSPPAATSIASTAKLEDELGLTEPEILETISSQVTKQDDQLLEEALLLEELSTLPTDDILQDDINDPLPPQPTEITTPTTPPTIKKAQKNLSQTSLSAFFPKVNQKDETVTVQSPTAVLSPGGRKLPPVELPATRGATKRASQKKDQPQESPSVKTEVNKKVPSSVEKEKRKSTDSRKSIDSKKSAGRDDADSLVSDEVSDEDDSHNSEDDPNRLWCICRKPHNNRFMICCDFCEDWFHGKCVGITKAMGEQMEENETEWMCPNCKKKKKLEEAAAKKQVEVTKTTPTVGNMNKKTSPTVAPVTPAVVETPPAPAKKPEANKVIVQQQRLVVLGQETPKANTKGTEIRITKVSSRKSMDDRKPAEETVSETAATEHHPPETGPAGECIVCKKESFPGGVYCSDECIAKHASESLSVLDKSSVIVFEKKTGRIFAGPNGPTPSTLTSWLMAHPSYEVMRPGVLPSAKYYNQPRSTPPVKQPRPALKQTVLLGQNRPQGIQLIAALPQLPPVEGPMKKNLHKSEPPSPTVTPKAKQQPSKGQQPVAKGQQQITTLLKVQQSKQDATETANKTTPAKSQVTPTVKKQPAKEQPKKVTPQPPVKKTTPTVVKKTLKEDERRDDVRGREQEEMNVRASVRKTLQDILTSRLQEVDDLKLSEDHIRKITTQIEEELHALFKDTNAKYKSKYRSLMFNMKDKANMTLFRKIADKSISPEQLVRLSPEELASQELAQWREREARHQLEMIKKTELDLMQQAKTVVMKTHKGDIVVENDDGLGAKILETSVEIEPVTVTTPSTPTVEPVVKPKEDLAKDKEGKHKKDKERKEEKHKERRHSSHGKEKSHKDHHKSRSRHRSRHRSESEQKSRSKSPEEKKSKEKVGTKQEEIKSSDRKSRSRHQHHERERSKSRPRERSKSRSQERSKSKPREQSKSSPRERSKSRPRDRSKSGLRERSKSRHRERSKSRPRERSKSRHRERSKSRLRKMSQDPDENKKSTVEVKKDEFVSEEKVIEEVKTSVQSSIIDAEIKDIIHDVVVEEETGPVEEDLSDREPSSTVNISTPPFNTFDEVGPEKPPIWQGTLIMPDVAKFSCSILEVSGICEDLPYDLPDNIDCVGRISPETAWDYIAKMKKSGTKQILVVRFAADNEEDKMSYLSFYSYLSSRNRLGVVGNNSKMIKDFYILPLPSHSPVPQVLLPLDGPGFEDYRPHLLLGIIVRSRRKRLMTDKDIPFVPKVAKKSERSYTPPLPEDGGHTPPTTHQHPETESFTPPHSPKPLRIIKLKPNKSKTVESPTVSEDFMLEDDTPYTPEDEEPDDADAPYSPGEGEDKPLSPGCSEELQRKVDKLNRMINDIEERKQKIDSGIMSPPQEIIMAVGNDEEEEEIEEAYSPSGSITPPPPDSSYLDKSKISLPSDLQEIIASLKKKPDEPKSMDLQSDPIVQAYRSADEPYSPEDEKPELEPEVSEKIASPASEESFSTQSSALSVAASVKVNRDPRQRPQLSLSQLSDEEIMKKASEMGFMNPENPEPIPDVLKSRVEHPSAIDELPHMHQPPPPPVYLNQPFTSSQPTFTPEFPPPHHSTHLPPPNFPPPHMFHSAPPPLPPLPPPHIPFTNPQPPPQPMYPPPPQQPAPLPPPPPESPDMSISKKKFSSSKKKKKSKEESSRRESRKEKKEKRRYSESPPPKDYDEREKIRERDRYSSKKREKRDTSPRRGGTWRPYKKSPPPEKRRDSWEYEPPSVGLPFNEPPPPKIMAGPSNHQFVPRAGQMRGRFQRGMRGGFRRGFDRGNRGGFHRGGFHQRGHHMGVTTGPPGPPRNFTPKNIQIEYEEDIRRFEEQRKQKTLERRQWRNESPPPKKRRGKESDSD